MKTEIPVGAHIREDHREMQRLFTELESRQSRPLPAPMLLALLAAHSSASVRTDSSARTVLSNAVTADPS